MNRSKQSSRGYDRLARVYRWLEFPLFGNDLQRARVAMLGELPPVHRVLILGDGDGRFLEQLCLAQPECQITSVDQSWAMSRLQRQRAEEIGAAERVTLIRGDARDVHPSSGEYDLLVTAFFLDCFDEKELAGLLPQWLNGVRRGGLYYFVDFTQPKMPWRRLRAGFYLTIMHWFFRWQTGLSNRRLVDLDAVLSEQPICLASSRSMNWEMIRCGLYRVRDSDQAD